MSGYRKTTASKFSWIEGTRLSVKNNQLILSTGVASVDTLLGGGLPVGSMVLVEEDADNVYAPFLLKYFLAEGVCCGHGLCFASPSQKSSEMFQLPATSDKDPSASLESSRSKHGTEDSRMKIAFRYESLGKFESGLEVSSKSISSHSFDLSKKMSWDQVGKCELHGIDLDAGGYDSLLSEVESLLSQNCYYAETDTESKKNVLRIGIQSLGSPMWGSEDELPKLFCLLKCLIRNRYACSAVTVPSHILKSTIVNRLRRHSDAVFSLKSFGDTQDNLALSQFHGLFRVIQLPRHHSLNSHVPDCLDLAFKLKRNRFSIEKLHLPPDLTQSDSLDYTAGNQCPTATKSYIDF